jgi:amino acid transporter
LEGRSLRRVVGALDLTALGVGAVIGTGIFVIIGEAIAELVNIGTPQLPGVTWLRFFVWMAAGLVIYAVYGYRHSRLRTGEHASAERVPGEASLQ